MNTTQDNVKKHGLSKSWLVAGLVASALALSACGQQEETPMENEPATDAQTAVEEDATAGSNDDVAVASADEDMVIEDGDEIATAEDADVLDGTESSESVSTY
ncbi:hypothetical protein [Psychrobacter sp.]|uniref:hypothetical protein n=1 Tax=Psychrobacter sp. TaxID=56811 RepID=UPI003F9D4DC6